MPKLSCPCGCVHNLPPIPDNGWKTIRDQSYEEVIEAHLLQEHLSAEEQSRADPSKKRDSIQASLTIANAWDSLYECPDCRRLMWRRESEEEFKIYNPES